MKIAIFSDTFLPQINGVTNTLDKLIKYFDENCIDYKIFVPQDSNQENYQNSIYSFLSFRFFLYPELRFAIPDVFSIKKVVEEYKPDLIHIVTPFNIGLCGLKIAKDLDIPAVASYHTDFSKYLKYYNLQFLDKWLWGFIGWFHGQFLINFCPSKDTEDELMRHGINNIELWGRGVDSDLFCPQKRSEKFREKHGIRNKIALLYVGRLAPEKDIDVLMEAFEVINEKYEDRLQLVITGKGPLEKELKSRWNKNVTFTGYMKGNELAEVYASCDIFVFPSVTETYGNVVLEAMAAGLPVIASMKGGVKENLINGYNGFEAEANQYNDYAEKIERLLLDDELRRSLGANAREHALKYTWSNIFNNLMQNYKKVLEGCAKKLNISA